MNNSQAPSSFAEHRLEAVIGNHRSKDLLEELEEYALLENEMTLPDRPSLLLHLGSCSSCQECVRALLASREKAKVFLASEEGKAWSVRFLEGASEALEESTALPLVSDLSPDTPSRAEELSPHRDEPAGKRHAEEPRLAQKEDLVLPDSKRWPCKPPLELFFCPEGAPHDQITRRLAEETLAKVALGGPCLEFLLERPLGRLFIESGSGPALAFQGIIQQWRNGASIPPGIRPEMNNALLSQGIWASVGISSRLLYGNKYYSPKYAGCFPVSEETINRAVAGNETAIYRVAKAWERMVAKARSFDVLFMTASKFHFVCGGFVGSPQNALFKAAFFSGCASKIVLILDGSKLLLNDGLRKEFEGCIPVSDMEFHPNARMFKALFPQPRVPDDLSLHEAAVRRNPCFGLKLRHCYVRYMTRSGRERRKAVPTPSSWADCVERLLSKNGEVWICISEPCAAPSGMPSGMPYSTYLDRAVKEANASFERGGSRVRIGVPDATEVRVSPHAFSLGPHGSESILVWKYPMVLQDRPARITVAQSSLHEEY